MLVAVVFCLGTVHAFPANPPETRWTMINVCGMSGQADCHLIEFPNGTKVMVDVADAVDAPGVAVASLRKRGVGSIDLVVLSHFHLDHYGRLRDLINAGVKVGRVVINLPASREVADQERPWGCNWEDVQATLAFLQAHRIPVVAAKAGDRLVDMMCDGVPVRLEVVCAFDGLNTPIGKTYVNDTSIVLRLTHGSIRVLFTGDLDAKMGAYVASHNFDLAADLLKVPHHGAAGSPPNSFFTRVNPRAAFVPAPRALWYSLLDKRVRTFFSGHHIPAYVSGIDGDVTVTLKPTTFDIVTELPREKSDRADTQELGAAAVR
jgi:competence protein ComEC